MNNITTVTVNNDKSFVAKSLNHLHAVTCYDLELRLARLGEIFSSTQTINDIRA